MPSTARLSFRLSLHPLRPLLVTLPLLLAACGGDEAAAPPPAEVFVAKPQVETVRDLAEYTGRFAGVDEVQVRARVSGYLEKVHFHDGQRVAAGDLLFTIDKRPFEAAVAQRRAAMQRAEADAKLADATARRVEKLRKTGSISVDQYDQRQTELQGAQAGVIEARAALQQAELNLEFTEIRAAVSGRVSRARITPGNVVTTGNSGTLLTTLVSDDPLYFYFTLSEADALKLQRSGILRGADADRSVQLKLSDEAAFTHQGKLDFVDNRVDAASGTVELRAIFQNPDKLLLPGQFGRVRIALSATHESLLVPEVALGFDQGSPYLLLVGEGDKVLFRPVQLGGKQGQRRVITSGIGRDDLIIVNGLQRARPGAVVKPTPATASNPTSAPQGAPAAKAADAAGKQ